ncbi:hypothetical protein [Herpetosiphon giganteus]|uniref:hypothetical protein n=1 Tax=Herpetosiphon giganteus TaxID=2029754 RepID=UPI00195ADEC2|nr:hypothetical protein [Herpetosiphon giganteus]MBM7846262.1 hypothetical protein [Herpetosiphon giganteus]
MPSLPKNDATVTDEFVALNEASRQYIDGKITIEDYDAAKNRYNQAYTRLLDRVVGLDTEKPEEAERGGLFRLRRRNQR